MPIPYGRQSINESDIAAVVKVLRSDWLTTGPGVASFERAISGVAGTPDAAVVSNGTAALHCAYAAIGVGPGDEVLTTPLTFAATAVTALAQGATIVFADVQEDTGNLDPGQAEAAITSRGLLRWATCHSSEYLAPMRARSGPVRFEPHSIG